MTLERAHGTQAVPWLPLPACQSNLPHLPWPRVSRTAAPRNRPNLLRNRQPAPEYRGPGGRRIRAGSRLHGSG